MFLPLVKPTTAAQLRKNPQDVFKAIACAFTFALGIGALVLSSSRFVETSGVGDDVVNGTQIGSIAASATAIVTAVLLLVALLRWREVDHYWSISCILTTLAVAAGGVITGVNFWLMGWFATQPTTVGDVAKWQLNSTKAGGLGAAILFVTLVHSLMMCVDLRGVDPSSVPGWFKCYLNFIDRFSSWFFGDKAQTEA